MEDEITKAQRRVEEINKKIKDNSDISAKLADREHQYQLKINTINECIENKEIEIEKFRETYEDV